ncbi:uncharacterized protein LOC143083749 [Mytilus galloprovincialis]|uniref:uncharacterized protein LOC143083749 n=1 Tax=Mytilus galloprovincialis TaxID=29158 RepID=UPI003F7BA028
MPSNVEIKAHLKDLAGVCKVAEQICTEGPTILQQEDTFFTVDKGRLKLRKIEGKTAQLIFYDRPDQTGPKFSDYNITEVANPDSLKETLGKCLGIKGEVKKTRTLYMVGQTRVHIDKVHNLNDGDFMELEVVMKEGQTVDEGQRIADDLMNKLGISKSDLISGAYIDMILGKS